MTKALSSLLCAQPSLLDLIPPMGYIQEFVNQLSKNVLVSKSSLLILNNLANNKPCIDSMIKYDKFLEQMMKAICGDIDLAGLVCETLTKVFVYESNLNDELVLKAIKIELVPFLLNLLDSGQSFFTSSTKALIVQLLKSINNNQAYGPQVSALLNKSGIWSEFKDQKHDLFITNSQNQRYLTSEADIQSQSLIT